MTAAQHRSIFGERRDKHVVTLTWGSQARRLALGPSSICAMSLAAGCAMAGLVALGFVSAGGQTVLPEVVTQDHALTELYETRIASLRSEVERLTTRSFVDQAKVASKVDILLDQQAELANRYAELGPLLDRVRSSGLAERASPTPNRASVSQDSKAAFPSPLAYGATGANSALDRFRLIDRSTGHAAQSEQPSPQLIREIAEALDQAEGKQIEGLDSLAERARRRSEAIRSVFRTEGIDIKQSPKTKGGEGGPFVPAPADRRFEASLQGLRSALDILDQVNSASASMPLARPAETNAISSTFGVRSDPFLGLAAMHTGIDFAAEPGSPVSATAGGKVTFAGENGSYGNMVEITHSNGLSTRYAHLSAILVSVGDQVRAGKTVGRVGSTGRSTGPHLHYEVRQAGEPVDPARYLRAGRRISSLG